MLSIEKKRILYYGLYAITSVFQSFGKQTNQIITLNLPMGDSVDFAMIVKSCLCLALFFTYPGMHYSVFILFS